MSSLTVIADGIRNDHVRVTRLESASLVVEVSPETGGRVTRLHHKGLGRDFLWRNPHVPLARVEPGAPYDPNFFGGIDDLIPGDAPEVIDGLPSPDHGELWSLPMVHRVEGGVVAMHGRMPVWGLDVTKRVSLRDDGPWLDLDYTIVNRSAARRVFLWRLHAALSIEPGDRIVCPARRAVAADPAWSRSGGAAPFAWPDGPRGPADLVPERDDTTEFLFLHDLQDGRVGLRRPRAGCELSITFDPGVFPYVCLFASYGGFDGHMTVVLEPSTAMPLSVVEAARLGQCSALESGETLATRMSIYAGPLVNTRT